MTFLSEFREKLEKFYSNYSIYIDIGLKFLIAVCSFFWIRSIMGFNSLLSNVFLLLVLALLSSIFSIRLIPVVAAFLVIGQAFGLGIDCGAVTVAVYIVLLFLFIRYVPDDSLAFLFTPIAMSFGLAALVPIAYGMKRKPSSVVSIGSGVVIYYLIETLSRTSDELEALGRSEYVARLNLLVANAFTEDVVVSVVAACAVVIGVYAVRNLSFDYSLYAAIPVGGAIYLIFILIGNSVVGTDFSVPNVLIGTIASLVVCYILLVFFLPLDYKKSEQFQLEDDDNYYYVKVIPKVHIESEYADEYESEELSEEETPEVDRPDVDTVDFEQKLEDSLKDL